MRFSSLGDLFSHLHATPGQGPPREAHIHKSTMHMAPPHTAHRTLTWHTARISDRDPDRRPHLGIERPSGSKSKLQIYGGKCSGRVGDTSANVCVGPVLGGRQPRHATGESHADRQGEGNGNDRDPDRNNLVQIQFRFHQYLVENIIFCYIFTEIVPLCAEG